MFWALISPFRHTAEPPRLGPNHPIRIFLQNHGAAIARHPLIAIVLSVVVSVILSYPFFIFYESTSPGLPSVPHHVWTSARPFSTIKTSPDIAIKQAWIQGSHMGALELEVVEVALQVQESLLGPEISCYVPPESNLDQSTPFQNALVNGSWSRQRSIFLHSPLLYWNCSKRAIQEDHDLVETVNKGSRRLSPSGLTLHWGSVFAGKKLSHHKLVAVDALVISLFYRPDSDIGAVWDQRATGLAVEAAKPNSKYDVYPNDGRIQSSTYYEFFFQNISKSDKIILMGAYLAASLYLASQLRRVRAVKSKAGLVLAILTQMAASIMSSFTLLAFLRVPVSHIPRGVFPFVVIVVGLENMVRLMNAVMDTPDELPTVVRIANALGEVGFLSTVAVATDVGLLVIVAHFSVPAVREFCAFAAIALVMDFILHLTYFLAVLSVDVRRLELQDFLERTDLSKTDGKWENRAPSPKKPTQNINAAFLTQAWPVSTRLAGSAIMICVLIALNMHFFDNEHPWWTIMSLFEGGTSTNRSAARDNISKNMPLNQARTPTSWLKLQDQITGKELIKIVKPGDHRLIAKVYEPLFVVMKDSSRINMKSAGANFLGYLDFDAMRGHLLPFALTVVVAAAFVIVLMNHMLMKEIPDDVEAEVEGPLLTTQTLCEGHSLDVVMVTACPKGIVVSVGLDRRIVVWNLRSKWGVTKDIVAPACSEQTLWPVMALALDQMGEWLAIAPRSGMISFWQIAEGTFYKSVNLDLQGLQPSTFFFAPRHEDHVCGGPRLIILRQNGVLTEICVLTSQIVHHRVCHSNVVSASHGVSSPKSSPKIVSASQQGRIFVTYTNYGDWLTHELLLQSVPPRPVAYGETNTILPLPNLGMVVSSRACSVYLVDLLSGSIVRSFQTGEFKPGTLRAFHAKRQTCLYCGCPSVRSFTICYSEKESGTFMMHTFSTVRGRSRDICLRVERDRREKKCTGFETVSETMHWLDNVEGWEATSLNMVAGIRRISSPDSEQSSDEYPLLRTQNLRQRGRKSKKFNSVREDEEWEGFTMTADGVASHYSLRGKNSHDNDSGLLVSRAGPVSRVGQRSVAVGFGNTLKVLFVGNERYDDDDDTNDDMAAAYNRRRNHRR